MKSRALLLLVAASIGLVACTAGAPAPSPTPAPSPAPTAPPSATPQPPGTMPAGLDGRHFVSTGVTDGDDEFPLVPGTRIDLMFEGGIRAQAGCNSIFGDYTIDGDRLIVGGLGQTEMGCEPPLMAQDEWLVAFLDSDPTFNLSGNDLTLTSGDIVTTLADREVVEPNQPLAGTMWVLTSIITGDAVSSVPDGVVATLQFAEDGTVQVNFGCNTGGGDYAVDGDRITFSNLIMTEMACAGVGGEVEQAVVSVLTADEVTYVIEADSLTLTAAGNGLQYVALDQPLS